MKGYSLGPFTIFLSLLLFFPGCNRDNAKCCDCLEAQGKSDEYIYPLTPASPGWANLKTGEQMYQACQIPSNRVKDMCTIGLIDSWLTYPLLLNVFAWVTPQKGIEAMQKNFDGLSELLVRSDAGVKLLVRYKILDPSGYDPQSSSADKGKFVISLTVFELTIAQKSIIEKLSSAGRKELVREALKKRTAKVLDKIYSPLSNPSDVYIMARTMIYDNYPEFVTILNSDTTIQHFSESAEYAYSATNPNPGQDLNTIIEIAKTYVSK